MSIKLNSKTLKGEHKVEWVQKGNGAMWTWEKFSEQCENKVILKRKT